MKNKIIVFMCILYFTSCNDGKKAILDSECIGVITKVYIDKKNHSIYKFEINSFAGLGFAADLYPKSWEYASIGDSIIKNKGESFITIKKTDGSFKIFDTRVK